MKAESASGIPTPDGEDDAAYLAALAKAQQRNWPNRLTRAPIYPLGEQSLGDYLRQRAKLHPEKPAILFYGATLSFQELDTLSENFATLLKTHGVTQGDRVAIFLQNCPQFLIAFYGILKAGAVYVPVNPMFKEAELEHELTVSKAKVILTLDTFHDMVESVRGRSSLTTVLTTSLRDMLPAAPVGLVPDVVLAPKRNCAGSIDLLPALQQSPADGTYPAVDMDATAALNFTGGTTGLPKACVHTQRHMLYTAATGGPLCFELSDDDVIICFVPLFWIAGEGIGMIMPIVFGSTLVLQTRWDPQAFIEAVERHRATHVFFMVDSAFEILAHPAAQRADMTSLKHAKTASFVKKIDASVRERWRALTGGSLHEVSWGMTETHTYDTFVTGFQDGDFDLSQQAIFVGLPVPGTEFKICDFETGALIPFGNPGELCVRSPSLTQEYVDESGTPHGALRDGWFHTGDVGQISEEGYVHFLGRRKEMIKVRGMSVFPAEIEALLGRHPQIAASAVVPRPDPEKGEVPVAFIQLASGVEATESDFVVWCQSRMASYKIPEFRFVPTLPMTATGKVRKVEIIEKYINS